ncbi:MAG: shufflon system plasmid conjugative transfer pilus tip adhesin PilV [Propionivibrio sp.]
MNHFFEIPMRTKRSQRGVTLLELLVTLGIIGAVMAGVAKLADQYIDDTKGALTAQQMVTVGNAAQAYIKDNYTTVMANATATTPAIITVPMLTAAGYLQSGFSTTNNYGHSVCVLVLEPTANNLNALVVAEGGTAIDDLTLGSIASGIGAAGGGIYASAPTTLRGAMGGWSTAVGNFANANASNLKCDGTAGTPTLAAGHPIMALWFANGDITSGFLYRNDVPGRPELNTMNTPIIMASVQTSGAACATTGSIARDANGLVLSCQSGTWKSQGASYWQDPVASVGALPACNASIAWQTRVVQTPGVGTRPRAYTCNGAGTWQPLALDNSGNLVLEGSTIAGAGAAGSYGAYTVQGNKNGWTGVEFRDASGNYQVNQMTNRGNVGYYDVATGRWWEYTDTSGNKTLDQTQDWGSGRLNPGWAVETWGCTTGQIAKAAYTVADGWAYNGKVLNCVSGVWKTAGGSSSAVKYGGGYTAMYAYTGAFSGCQSANYVTGGCSCPAGYSPKLVGMGAINMYWLGDNYSYGYACEAPG